MFSALVFWRRGFVMNRCFASPAAISTGIMSAMTLNVLNALATLMAVGSCTDHILLLFFWSCTASAYICSYSSDKVSSLVRSVRLLLLWPPVFGSILASAVYVLETLSHVMSPNMTSVWWSANGRPTESRYFLMISTMLVGVCACASTTRIICQINLMSATLER